MSEARDEKPAWHEAYPKPKSEPPRVSHDILREMIEESAGDEDTGFVVVDVRRNDFEGLSVKDAVNIPAQSLPLALSTWSKVFGDRTVIFYCGSSNGRDHPRDLADPIKDLDENKLPGEAAILDGGIKEWTKHYSTVDGLVTKIPDLN
ncbi:putative Arsenate reductase [Taphrina deformans PYCC 5710]|uniref:Arsenate reductase n=1 Tax=Taphrina deformans (strain PYCC 5710 / ATCC 11124 / CBS 356.35 / IMI 108563 / JCM 9778 / NBRC 8474) TaxID=1097556 RepID=R4XCI0_TAPDE|nr:putative Arsenate reductase [Taphrina deformans PYCC 5710]|eukprot:CCG83531.1 putative Arsenate reductase [Taphrina deformans PYCC 5710]